MLLHVCLMTRHKRTVAQIMLRWSVQKGYITIPKSTQQERIVENADIFNFNLAVGDMKLLVNSAPS